MRRSLLSAVILLALGVTTGCGGARPIHYYTLNLPPSPPAAGNSYPVALLVRHFGAPSLFRDDRIVYRAGGTQMGTYQYHRWAEPPPEMLETLLIRMLRVSGKYRSVAEERSNASGDFVLRGRLLELEEVDEGSIEARVVMEMELEQKKSGAIVWSHFYSHDEPVEGKDFSAVVEALNENVRRGLEEIIQGIDAYFAKTPP